MRHTIYCLAINLLFVAVTVHTAAAQSEHDYFAPMPEAFYEGLEFDMPRVAVPTFPGYTVSVEDFGAVGDGEALNTEAFEDAITHVAERGGGCVVIPRGIWRAGPIVLQSNVNLHTERGAFVLFSDDLDAYPLIETSFEGLDTYCAMSPIYGKGLEVETLVA